MYSQGRKDSEIEFLARRVCFTMFSMKIFCSHHSSIEYCCCCLVSTHGYVESNSLPFSLEISLKETIFYKSLKEVLYIYIDQGNLQYRKVRV